MKITPKQSFRPAGSSRGFTMIELLTVIAIIGLLAAIIIPVMGKVREKAKSAKTKIQFTQWAAAIEKFKQEYSYYPVFSDACDNKVNGSMLYNYAGSSLSGNQAFFQEVLTGKPVVSAGFVSNEGNKTGSVTTRAQNSKHFNFYAFGSDEISNSAGGAIQDAFGNLEIAVIVDENGDGFITKEDAKNSTFPDLTSSVQPGDVLSGTDVLDSDAFPKSGTTPKYRGTILFYSPGFAKKEQGTGKINPFNAVLSWR